MAHAEDKRRSVRAAYVFEQLSLEMAALKHDVPFATVRNWKKAGKELGDDWDKARGAQMIAGGGIEDVVRQTLGIVVQQVQVTLETIQTATDMSPVVKVQMLTSLADAYNKLMAVSIRMMPETDKLAVATDVMKRLVEFTSKHYPRHANALIEVIEPFGDSLVKAYG